jgi:hypothetical protein
MPDVPIKVLQFLDQVMPFLEASPAWFKVRIYSLIVLNCATLAGMAIFYLVSRAEHKAKRELKSFSIERPQANEEIPLGENESWISCKWRPARICAKRLRSLSKYSNVRTDKKFSRTARRGFRALEIGDSNRQSSMEKDLMRSWLPPLCRDGTQWGIEPALAFI